MESRRRELAGVIGELYWAAESAQSACGEAYEKRSEVGAQMWASCKKLTLICSPELRDRAHEYCDRLNEALWAAIDGPAWKPALSASLAFQQAARNEIDRA